MDCTELTHERQITHESVSAHVVFQPGVGATNRNLCRPPPGWKQQDAPMTMGQLLSKRDEFWDTAPAFNGRAEIWQVG